MRRGNAARSWRSRPRKHRAPGPAAGPSPGGSIRGAPPPTATPAPGPGARASWNVVAFGAQDGGQRDQRQPHERGRVVAAQAREQAHAQPFALGAAGAIERMLALEIALD